MTRLISIIGPPAVGKTTLAKRLADELPARLLLEDYAGNPFLADACRGQSWARLPCQLHFLFSRVGQLDEAFWPARGLAVSDYGFCQDRIYARARLTRRELLRYERIARHVDGRVHSPDVVIRLDASPMALLRRIRRRGRRFERVMDLAFLERMRRAYRWAVEDFHCPVIELDCEVLDLRRARDRRPVIDLLRGLLGPRAGAARRRGARS